VQTSPRALDEVRGDAKVLADRIGVRPGQLWDDGVRAGVTTINDTDVLIEPGGGAVLAARRLDPAHHPAKVRLSIEPTGLPLVLESDRAKR
jgi:hypothetical protein